MTIFNNAMRNIERRYNILNSILQEILANRKREDFRYRSINVFSDVIIRKISGIYYSM